MMPRSLISAADLHEQNPAHHAKRRAYQVHWLASSTMPPLVRGHPPVKFVRAPAASSTCDRQKSSLSAGTFKACEPKKGTALKLPLSSQRLDQPIDVGRRVVEMT